MIPDIWLQTRGTWNAVEEFETLSLRRWCVVNND
jgi:hypothetical protein